MCTGRSVPGMKQLHCNTDTISLAWLGIYPSKGKAVPVRAMKWRSGSRGKAPLILNVSASRR